MLYVPSASLVRFGRVEGVFSSSHSAKLRHCGPAVQFIRFDRVLCTSYVVCVDELDKYDESWR